MITGIRRVFKLYARRHGQSKLSGFPLLDTDGLQFGDVVQVTFGDGRLTVDGWASAEMVGLSNGNSTSEKKLAPNRADAVIRLGHGSQREVRFEISIPNGPDCAELIVVRNGNRFKFTLPQLTKRDAARVQRQQVIPFLRDLLRALPVGLRWIRHRDLRDFTRILGILGLTYDPRTQQLNPLLFAKNDGDRLVPPVIAPTITIIIPIYNAFELLPEVLGRVVENTDLPWRLILIEDQSSDQRVRPWLKRWLSGLATPVAAQIDILENDLNIGFVQSVNRGFDVARRLGHHVVLLNSDAFVPKNWASRLITPLVEGKRVATVTAMSNDAEIFSCPVSNLANRLLPGEADAIDLVAQSFSRHASLADAPTGVGYCMAIHCDYLENLPKLDPAFGRGYGEEVDWCQRARQLGGRHLGHGGVFVEHRSGSSFLNDDKLRLIRDHNQLISNRYPTYDSDVQDFVRNDPLATPRLALALAWAAEREPDDSIVYLAHSLGGGAENYLQRRIEDDLKYRAAVLVLRVGGPSKWRIELHSELGITRGDTDSTDFIYELLDLLPKRTVIYSCGVGDPDPRSLPSVLLTLANRPQDRLQVLFHDYLPLSPSYTLLSADGIYHGPPLLSAAQPSSADNNLADWQGAWGALLQRADQVTVFSEDSRGIVACTYPEIATKIEVIPHELLTKVPAVSPGKSRDGVPVIGVLGNIGYQKGASVVRDLAHISATTGQARIVVLGQIDSSYDVVPPSSVHGSYQVQDIPRLVAEYGISQWLIPSIWPETFSYTTHEALATGLPVWTFDIGAQGAAAKKAAEHTNRGGIIPIESALKNPKIILDLMLGTSKFD